MAADIAPQRFIVDNRGKPQAVILSFVTYQELVRMAEDREDIRALRQAMRTSRHLISHDELMGRLKRRGSI